MNPLPTEEVVMFALVVRFTVLPGHLEAFDALVGETIAAIRTDEPGTVSYLSHARPECPGERVFYEAYQDRSAFDAHESTPHTRRFLDQRGQHLATEPEVWWLTSLGDQPAPAGPITTGEDGR